jgi:hypothetical protein
MAKTGVLSLRGRPPMRTDNARTSRAAPGREVQPDDATIIGLSRADPEQFAVVFRRHAPAIQRYVTRRIGPDPADDVVAETFLVAFRQRAEAQLVDFATRAASISPGRAPGPHDWIFVKT